MICQSDKGGIMSYEIVKSISRKKDNRIFVTSACNNLWPRTYSKWEYMPNEKCTEKEIHNKMLYLFHDLIGGNLQLSGSVDSKWRYAENKFFEYCKKNNLSYHDLWNVPYKDDNYNIELLKPYYDVFESYLAEKNKEGDYYLKSNLGYITKVNKRSFEYSFRLDKNKCCKDFKKVYNDYCKLSNDSINKYDIKIEEYQLEENKEDEMNNNMEFSL